MTNFDYKEHAEGLQRDYDLLLAEYNDLKAQRPSRSDIKPLTDEEIRKAITAIKEALMSVPDGTQPDLNLNCKSVQARLATAWGYVKAQPEQEPVAWMIWTHGPVLVFMNKDEANLEFDRLNHAYPEPTRMLVPLYTTPPPQRKPLTDEQINEFFQGMEPNNGFWLSFARAIEAAHGIYAPTERKGEA